MKFLPLFCFIVIGCNSITSNSVVPNPTTYQCSKNGYYAKISKINDSLASIYFFTSIDDTTFTNLVFIKNNKCMSYIEYRTGDSTIGDYFNLNDSSKYFIKTINSSSFKISDLIFKIDKKNSLSNIDKLPKYSFFPPIKHDHYYYFLKDSIVEKNVCLYLEPTSFSKFKIIDIKKNFYGKAFTVSTKYFYFNSDDVFYQIGFGSSTNSSDDDFNNIFYIKESDLKSTFYRER